MSMMMATMICSVKEKILLLFTSITGTAHFKKCFNTRLMVGLGPTQRRVQFFDVDGDGLMDLVSMSGEIVWQKQTSSNPLTFSDPSYLNVETATERNTGICLV